MFYYVDKEAFTSQTHSLRVFACLKQELGTALLETFFQLLAKIVLYDSAGAVVDKKCTRLLLASVHPMCAGRFINQIKKNEKKASVSGVIYLLLSLLDSCVLLLSIFGPLQQHSEKVLMNVNQKTRLVPVWIGCCSRRGQIYFLSPYWVPSFQAFA